MAAAQKSSLSAYGGRLADFAPLTRDRERELALRWKNEGDSAAADELVKAHLRYVVATAIKFRRYGIPLDELIAEGSFGVVHALGKFDPERGTRFVTYAAYWIRAYILNYVLRSWSMVGSGAGALRSKNFFRLRRERARVSNLFTDEAEAQAELAKRLEVPEPQLRAMLDRLDTRDVSLDGQMFDGSSARLIDTLVAQDDDQETSLGDDQSRDHRAEAVRLAVVKLDDRERFIVERRMMADRDDELSLAEIGRRLGVSRERARQLEVRAKGKLRALLDGSLPGNDLSGSGAAAAPSSRRADGEVAGSHLAGAEFSGDRSPAHRVSAEPVSVSPVPGNDSGNDSGSDAGNGGNGASAEKRELAKRCA